MRPEIAIAHYMLGKLSSERIVQLANTWLEEGLYTDSINLMAMEHAPVMSDVGPMLEKTIIELGLPIPTKVQAARIAARDIVEQMVSGTVDLMEGANFLYWNIHHEITDELPDGEYLGTNLGLEHVFGWLREVWDCPDGSDQKFLEHLKDEARKWLEKQA